MLFEKPLLCLRAGIRLLFCEFVQQGECSEAASVYWALRKLEPLVAFNYNGEVLFGLASFGLRVDDAFLKEEQRNEPT